MLLLTVTDNTIKNPVTVSERAGLTQQNQLTHTMAFIIIVIAVAVLIGLNLYLRSKERHKMLDKGLDPSLLEIYETRRSNLFLYAGIILLGVALGAISGLLIAKILDARGVTEEFMLLGLITWGGISCFVCYYVSRAKDK